MCTLFGALEEEEECLSSKESTSLAEMNEQSGSEDSLKGEKYKSPVFLPENSRTEEPEVSGH